MPPGATEKEIAQSHQRQRAAGTAGVRRVQKATRSYPHISTPAPAPTRAAVRAAASRRGPVFPANSEGPKFYRQAYRRNAKLATPGPYQTALSPPEESAFRHWARETSQNTGLTIPVHGKTDYDYRGFFRATGGAHQAGTHFPDTFKTPYDTTFSRESKYATKNNPLTWKGNSLVNRKTGRLVTRSTQ